MAASKDGNIRKSIQNKIDRMTVEIAIDILLCRSNRAASINRIDEYIGSWLGGIVRWSEEDYATVIAQIKLGYAPQFHIHDAPLDDEEAVMTSTAFRHTQRYYYVTTDDDDNEVERETYL